MFHFLFSSRNRKNLINPLMNENEEKKRFHNDINKSMEKRRIKKNKINVEFPLIDVEEEIKMQIKQTRK
jgi:hypothetical protein